MQLIRSLASLLLSLAVAQAQGVERWFGSPKLWPFLAARGFIGAASMTLYYEGIARMPLADAVGFLHLYAISWLTWQAWAAGKHALEALHYCPFLLRSTVISRLFPGQRSRGVACCKS